MRLGRKRRSLTGPRNRASSAITRENIMGRLEGKVAIVTGAASGIGRASAKLFAAEGAAVVAVDRAKEIEDTARAIADAGGRAIAMTADASAEADVAGAVDRAVREFGTLDVMFANAGISGGGQRPFFELDANDWRQILDVNLIGVFLAIKHAARVMVPNRKGSIVCTASVAGIRSGAGGGPYSASKAGVINLTTTAANYLTGTNVRVNAICPGIIETGMTRPIFDYAEQRGTKDRIGQLNPLKRYGVPSEIAWMALFLASDEASYVNGQHIAVDGGLTSSMPVTGRIGR